MVSHELGRSENKAERYFQKVPIFGNPKLMFSSCIIQIIMSMLISPKEEKCMRWWLRIGSALEVIPKATE